MVVTKRPAEDRGALRSFLALTLCLLLIGAAAEASEDNFITPNNWGATGLMEIPSARIMKENTYRVGAGQVYPYRYYYAALGAWKGLEVDGRFTEIIGVKALTEGYGNYKDKAFDLKYQLIPEGVYLPAIAVGIMDPQGTRLYPGQYIVASKRIFPFDLTIGLGNGRFGKRPLAPSDESFKVELFQDPAQWLRDSNVFWGIQFSPSPRYALMAEYNPIEYDKQIYDPAYKKYFTRGVPLKYNFGFRWRPWDWADIDVTYQRGNQWGLNLSTLFNIGDPLFPMADKPYIELPAQRGNPLEVRLTQAMRLSGFSNIGIAFDGTNLFIEAQNDKYFYTTRAIGVICGLVDKIAPRNVKDVRILITDVGIPVVDFSTTREDIFEFLEEHLTPAQFFYMAKMKTAISEMPDTTIRARKYFDYGIAPAFSTYLNDPTGFFKYRLGLLGWVGFHPWKGNTILASVETYPFNTVSTNTPPLSIPVRSDIVPYLEENLILSRLMVNQVYKTDNSIYGRLAFGFLEVEYGGVEGEAAMPVLDGRLLVGVSGAVVKKRAVGKPLCFKENDVKNYYDPIFFKTRLNVPEKEVYLDVMAGRFLAGDKGVRVSVSKFIKGVTISAWYSWTDTSIFSDPFNRGYHDKGISVTIPIRLFEGTDSKTTYNYTLTPWTRDVGQDLYHYMNLFDYMGRNIPIYLRKDLKMMQGG